jgi:RNA polymerase sigma-70 factor (ECF subfamily)
MTADTAGGAPGGGFPTTAWTFIRAAQDPDHPEHVDALNQLITRYWRPVFYFLRARGHGLHAAEDLTQEFFARALERDWLRRADPQRGRFRTFLLTILVRFLSDRGDCRGPRQQRFERGFVSVESLLQDDDRRYEPAGGEAPEAIFMRQWAVALVAEVRRRLKKLCRDRDRETWYDIFVAIHDGGASQEETAACLGLSRDQVRYALEQVNRWLMVLLRAEVRDQVDSEADVGDEIRELLDLLRA